MTLVGGIIQMVLSPIVTLWIFIMLLGLLFIVEILNKSYLLPSGNFTVPNEWAQAGNTKSAITWGTILGLGFITYQGSVLFHVYSLSLVLVSEWWYGLLGGIIFGFVRASAGINPFLRKYALKYAFTLQGKKSKIMIMRKFVSITILAALIIVVMAVFLQLDDLKVITFVN